MTPAQIQQAHAIDDLCIANARLIRSIRSALPLLQDARDALADGRFDIVDEFLDRSIDLITKGQPGL